MKKIDLSDSCKLCLILELDDNPTLQLFLAAETGQAEIFEEIYQGDDYQNPKDDESMYHICHRLI